MRYILRNKKKIIKAYSHAFVLRLLDSLDEAFKGDILPEDVQGEKYQVIVINDVTHSCGLIVFYVISRRFDVLNLAYKEVIN